MSIQFWRFWEWPDKERVEITKQRDIVELFLGDKGYEITYKGTTTQDPKEMEDYLRRRDHSLEWVVRKWLPTSGTMILYSGTAMVEQNLADQVTVLNGNNDSVTLSVDPRTHLPVRTSYSWRDPIDRQMDEESVVYANYQAGAGHSDPLQHGAQSQWRDDEPAIHHGGDLQRRSGADALRNQGHHVQPGQTAGEVTCR